MGFTSLGGVDLFVTVKDQENVSPTLIMSVGVGVSLQRTSAKLSPGLKKMLPEMSANTVISLFFFIFFLLS
jgi:hypothetical protein